MGLEPRNNNGKLYYYRKRREGKRVVSEYVGGGEWAQAAYTLEVIDREEREYERAILKQERDQERELSRQIDSLGDTVRALTGAVLLANGYHTHKGQWRRRRT